MVNPYKSPDDGLDNEPKSVSQWSRRKCWGLALSFFLLLGPGHYFAQQQVFSRQLSVSETLLWPELIGALLAITTVGLQSKRSSSHWFCVGVYVAATAGLARILILATEYFTAWYTGVPVWRFVLVDRIFGDHAWFFWLKIAVICAGPLLLCVPQIGGRIRLSVPMLLVLVLASVFLLRLEYLFRSDTIPSSYRMIFWPF